MIDPQLKEIELDVLLALALRLGLSSETLLESISDGKSGIRSSCALAVLWVNKLRRTTTSKQCRGNAATPWVFEKVVLF